MHLELERIWERGGEIRNAYNILVGIYQGKRPGIDRRMVLNWGVQK